MPIPLVPGFEAVKHDRHLARSTSVNEETVLQFLAIGRDKVTKPGDRDSAGGSLALLDGVFNIDTDVFDYHRHISGVH
jgi:hypothetical protein